MSADNNQSESGFEIINACDLNPGPVEWIIEDLIPKNGITFIVGSSGSYKTYFTLQSGLCIASGKPFLGFTTEKMKVLYLDLENFKVTMNHKLDILGFTQADRPEELIFAWPNGLKFNADTLKQKLIQLCKAHHPGVLIIDCFVRIFEGDANNSTDLNKYHSALSSVIRECDVSIIVIHHLRKREGKKKITIDDIRGSGDIVGMSNAILSIYANKYTQTVSIYELKQRDATGDKEIVTHIRPVEDGGFRFDLSSASHRELGESGKLLSISSQMESLTKTNPQKVWKRSEFLEIYKKEGSNGTIDGAIKFLKEKGVLIDAEFGKYRRKE